MSAAQRLNQQLTEQLAELDRTGLYKRERQIASAQAGRVRLADGREVINLCANNYLGLADSRELIQAAHAALDSHGFGMASVRFICGTQDIHRQLEQRIARWLGTEDAILFPSAFDANGGVFEALLGPEDAVISDALNHASLIDGIRLSKAQRHRYANCDLAELEACLIKAADARTRLIVTDGVFSMDGTIAPLDKICDLADKHDALVMIDDAHAHGFLGAHGRGTPEFRDCEGRIAVITGTLGKALGGAMGGYTTGKKEIIEMLRQRSRPYLFSNSLAPAIVGASIKVFELLSRDDSLKKTLDRNTAYFKKGMKALGFDIIDGESAIVPVMLYDAKLSQEMAERLLEKGIYVIGFFYPVVPKGKARIRVQLSAAHELEHLDRAIMAFKEVGRDLGVI